MKPPSYAHHIVLLFLQKCSFFSGFPHRGTIHAKALKTATKRVLGPVVENWLNINNSAIPESSAYKRELVTPLSQDVSVEETDILTMLCNTRSDCAFPRPRAPSFSGNWVLESSKTAV
jgi:hypothetical protein